MDSKSHSFIRIHQTRGKNMKITYRSYKILADFERVNRLLRANYQTGNMLQPRFEYAHAHPSFQWQDTHRFVVMEDEGELVGIACFESSLGEAFLSVKRGYESQKINLLTMAESQLSLKTEQKQKLIVTVNALETTFKTELQALGYEKVGEEPIHVYSYEQGFKACVLPDGFKLISLADENDFLKIHHVIWKGFNHGDTPDDDVDCRKWMQTAPNFKPDLTMVCQAPNGEYASFVGMWVDEINQYAYLEPVATDPKYRKLGLAKAAIMESMRRSMQYGARYCYGGEISFYPTIGFARVGQYERFRRIWSD